MSKTFCLQFWCCSSFALSRSELGSEFTRVTLCFYRWWWDPGQDVHPTPRMPSKPSRWQTPLFPIASNSYVLGRWRYWALWMPQPPEKRNGNYASDGTVVQLLTGSRSLQWTWPHKLLAVNWGGGVVSKPMCSFGREDRDDITREHPLATGVKWHRSSVRGGCQPSLPLD